MERKLHTPTIPRYLPRLTLRIQPPRPEGPACQPPHWPFAPLTPLQMRRHQAQAAAIRQGAAL